MTEPAHDAFADVPAHFRREAPQDAHQRRRHQAVLSLLAEVPPGRVLDYGFGWGDIAWAAAKTHPDLHAVDVEQRRVDFAREQYAPLPFDRCRPDGLDLPDASFDVVLSIVVLPFVPDDDAYVATAIRLGRDDAARDALRTRLLAAKASSPLFDMARFAAGFAGVAGRMADRRRKGLPPAPLD